MCPHPHQSTMRVGTVLKQVVKDSLARALFWRNWRRSETSDLELIHQGQSSKNKKQIKTDQRTMWYASPCVWNSVLPYRLKINMEANFASWPILTNSKGETFLKSELDWKIVALTLYRFDCSSDCPSIIYPLAIKDVKFTSACRGHPFYQKVWKPTLNEELQVCSTPSTLLVSFYVYQLSVPVRLRLWTIL